MTRPKARRSFERFSNLQWYLAHSRNVIHFVWASPQALSEDHVEHVVRAFLDRVPRLADAESLADDGFVPARPDAQGEIIRFVRQPEPFVALEAINRLVAEPLPDMGAPAIAAHCFTSDRADGAGIRSWLAIRAAHSAIEGADFVDIVRNNGAPNGRRAPMASPRLGPVPGVAATLAVPLAYVAGQAIAARSTGDRTAFGFHRVTLARDDVGRVARDLGVSQRALLFGLVLHSTVHDPLRKRRVRAAVPFLPKTRAAGEDDPYFDVRIDAIGYTGPDDLAAYVVGLDKLLAARPDDNLFVQSVANRTLGLQRWLHRNLPRLVHPRSFDSNFYDMVLTIVPPLRSARLLPALDGATFFGGTMTGTAATCAFVVEQEAVSLTFWAGPEIAARLGALAGAAEGLGVAAEIWR